MDKKKWIAIAVTAVAVIGTLALIKVCPFYVSILGLVDFLVGGFVGYLLKKKEIIKETVTVEVPVEKIVEKVVYKKPSKKSSTAVNKEE